MSKPSADEISQNPAGNTGPVQEVLLVDPGPPLWTTAKELTDFFGDALTVIASIIAIWIFATKQREIRAFAKAISNFVHQNSLAELRLKLETIVNLNASDDEQRAEIVSIFHDICGQIDGSPMLRKKLGELSDKIRAKMSPKRRALTEPDKRSLASELREALRHFDSVDYAEAIGEKK